MPRLWREGLIRQVDLSDSVGGWRMVKVALAAVIHLVLTTMLGSEEPPYKLFQLIL